MAYFKIQGSDFSSIVSGLEIKTSYNYSSQTNANGDTVVDMTSSKRNIVVSFIALDDNKMTELTNKLKALQRTITILNPNTQAEEDIVCICPETDFQYYTIQAGNVSFKAFNLTFIEL